ncbi:hypothetical protein O988_08870 [Pseudogymnoascus sp. VKM F-3808]|nr:hypothetical protein O988_08870 [Pseudogymnoascus sp. VKM F-3808]
MASSLTKRLSTILTRRQHKKIAVLTLDSDTSALDLLKHLCGTITEIRGGKFGQVVHTGRTTSRSRSFLNRVFEIELVVVELGGDCHPAWNFFNASQYTDADGFVWLVDSRDWERIVEVGELIGTARRGRKLGLGLEQVAVKAEAPWLVAVDFKGEALSNDEAKRQGEVVIAREGEGLDWTSRAVSTTTFEGVQEAMGWLYEKLK